MPATDHGHAPIIISDPTSGHCQGQGRGLSLSPEEKGVLSRQEKIHGQDEPVGGVPVFPVNSFFVLSLLSSILLLFLLVPYLIAVPS